MQSAEAAVVGNGSSDVVKNLRDQALRDMFRPDELVWLVDEQFKPVDTTWRVDMVRQGLQGAWMRQRFRYDVPSGVIYFLGERPLSEAELATVRRTGKLFTPQPPANTAP